MFQFFRVRAWLHWNVWHHQMSFETFFMLPIGIHSFFFSVSQWEASKMFQATSDAIHIFQCNQSLALLTFFFTLYKILTLSSAIQSCTKPVCCQRPFSCGFCFWYGKRKLLGHRAFGGEVHGSIYGVEHGRLNFYCSLNLFHLLTSLKSLAFIKRIWS